MKQTFARRTDGMYKIIIKVIMRVKNTYTIVYKTVFHFSNGCSINNLSYKVKKLISIIIHPTIYKPPYLYINQDMTNFEISCKVYQVSRTKQKIVHVYTTFKYQNNLPLPLPPPSGRYIS